MEFIDSKKILNNTRTTKSHSDHTSSTRNKYGEDDIWYNVYEMNVKVFLFSFTIEATMNRGNIPILILLLLYFIDLFDVPHQFSGGRTHNMSIQNYITAVPHPPQHYTSTFLNDRWTWIADISYNSLMHSPFYYYYYYYRSFSFPFG